MTYYHAVFADECGGEFGAGVEADSKDEARQLLSENYPESRIVQLEGPNDTAEREAEIYARVLEEDWDSYDYEDLEGEE